MASFCSLCSSISFLDLPPFPPSLVGFHVPYKPHSELLPWLTKRTKTPEGKVKMPVGSLGLAHHPTLSALQEAAKTCNICTFIEQSVDRVRAVLEEAAGDKFYVEYDKTGPPVWEFFLSKRKEGEDGFLVWSMAERGEDAYLVGAVGFCVDDESPLKNHFRGRIVHEDPTLPAVLGRLRKWVAICDEDHSKCHPGDDTDLPFRVLDLADPNLDSNTIKLAEPPSGTKGRYASLSHCWGKSPQFTTTKATMTARKTGIDVSGLPQTFQDAIIVSRGLGIRYIWVDSLCICQDDGADWERESAKMASIYKQSYLTIAAARASDDEEGFLGPREARTHIPIVVTVPAANGNDEPITGTIHLFNINLYFAARGHAYVEDTKAPLTKRGWVVQERFLAPRTLHYGSSQISFECIEIFRTEDGHEQTISLYNIDELPVKDLTNMGVDRDFSFRGSARWYETVSIYSRKALSWESDKLPAFSGLARLFEGILDDTYVAGLWRSTIIEGMCYQTFGDTHSRPSKYRAPSWSWASIDGMVAVTSIGSWEDLVEVVDVGVQVKGQNPFGEVSGGSIEFRGASLERITIRQQKLGVNEDIDTNHGAFRWWYGTDERVGEEEENRGRFDIESDIETDLQNLELYILPLVMDLQDDDRTCFALVVVPDGQGQHKRVGWSMMDAKEKILDLKSVKEKGELKTIVLV